MSKTPRPWLKEARRRSGLSARALSMLMECSESIIGQWEAGSRTPMAAHRRELARVIGERVPGQGRLVAAMFAAETALQETQLKGAV